nr:hypothetical protein [Oryza sativa Japonica Group]
MKDVASDNDDTRQECRGMGAGGSMKKHATSSERQERTTATSVADVGLLLLAMPDQGRHLELEPLVAMSNLKQTEEITTRSDRLQQLASTLGRAHLLHIRRMTLGSSKSQEVMEVVRMSVCGV